MVAQQRPDVAMSAVEAATFIDQSRVATFATNGSSGNPHLVAMFYGVIDGEIWFGTKSKSQKTVNLRRDERLTCMIEAGHTYDTLRGVSLEGRGEVVDTADALEAVGRSIWERYYGPHPGDAGRFIAESMKKRVAVRLEVERTRTWDHRKLPLPTTEPRGTTAAYLGALGPG